MYAAGLTVREISDHCHAVRSTVQRHLQFRERYEPGTQARHETALASRTPGRPSTNWRKRLKEVEAFQAEHGRLPSQTGDVTEVSLNGWVSRQRADYLGGRMSAPKIILLGTLTGWNIDPFKRDLENHWQERLGQLVAYTAETGSYPRWKNYASEHEHAIGIWLHGQRQARTERRLIPHRRQALDAAVPGWTSRE